ncbi:MAG: hypothetical protein QM758_07335 [Armatimonas sp.]
MRRTFLKEESPTRLTPVPQGTAEVAPERQSVQEAPQRAGARKAAPTHREKDSPLKGRLLKGSLVIFGGLGVLSLLMPLLTGVSVNEAMQNSSVKAAYTGSYLNYTRASASLKLGNLGATTDALLTLPKESAESREIALALFPRLLDAREYGRAAQVLSYLYAEKPRSSDTLPVSLQASNGAPSALTAGELGTRMATDIGLEKAMTLLAQDSNLSSMRETLLAPIFLGAAQKELPALEKLAPTLHPKERGIAADVIQITYLNAKNWEGAWHSTGLFAPGSQQQRAKQLVLTEVAKVEPKEALKRLEALRSSSEFAQYQQGVFEGLAGYHPVEALQFIQQLDSPYLRDQAIGILLARQTTIVEMLPADQILALLDAQTDPTVKAQTLVQVNLAANQAKNITPEEFLRKEIAPRLNALARKNPTLVPLNDQFMLECIARNSIKELQAGYLSQMLDPATQATAKKDLESGEFAKKVQFGTQRDILTKARNSRFSFSKSQSGK